VGHVSSPRRLWAMAKPGTRRPLLWLTNACPVLTIWMDGWQMQCCGNPFRIGSRVEWTLVADPDRDFLTSVLGDDIASAVTHWEEHHGGLPDDAPATAGVVRAIRAVRCRYGRNPGQPDGALYPMAGSAIITQIESADGWDVDDGEAKFVAYLIELDGA
jgi:hypothetical protein